MGGIQHYTVSWRGLTPSYSRCESCIYWSCSGNVKDPLGILTRREKGTNPLHSDPKILERACISGNTDVATPPPSTPFPVSLSPSFFSFPFPHSLVLPPLLLAPPLSSVPVCSYSCGLCCSGGRGQCIGCWWGRSLTSPTPVLGGITFQGTVPGVFSSPWGSWAWHSPFLVTIQPVFRFFV